FTSGGLVFIPNLTGDNDVTTLHSYPFAPFLTSSLTLPDQHSPDRLAEKCQCAILTDTRLGIEGNHWLRKLLQNHVKEPAVVAMGGIPLGLRAAIERELDLLK
ncbi:hypothetical protein BC938DRAFT_476875, partial [Jimgerdemannia flammicorona]